MGEEIAFENGRISDFQGLVTLTLDRVIGRLGGVDLIIKSNVTLWRSSVCLSLESRSRLFANFNRERGAFSSLPQCTVFGDTQAYRSK